MRSASSIPSTAEREAAYEALQWSTQLIPSEDILSWAAWTRFDPRLGQLLVDYLAKNFEKYNPYLIYKSLLVHECPQTFLVIAEFTLEKLKGESRFEAWLQTLKWKMPKADFQNFFIGLDVISPQQLREKISRSLRAYLNWGYWGTEDLANLNKGLGGGPRKSRSRIPKVRRMQVLAQLLKSNNRIKVRDYIYELSGNIHPRQAERDLKSFPGIKMEGSTKSRVYYLR